MWFAFVGIATFNTKKVSSVRNIILLTICECYHTKHICTIELNMMYKSSGKIYEDTPSKCIIIMCRGNFFQSGKAEQYTLRGVIFFINHTGVCRELNWNKKKKGL